MKEAHESIPHLFRCPISLELLKDPVTLSTGQTYERSSIEKWLATGNLTCPVTMQKLHDPSFVPNNTLRHFIHQWLQMGAQIHPHYVSAIDSLASLRNKLESDEISFDYKLQVIQRVRVFAEESRSSSFCLIQFGFLSVLLELMFGKEEIKAAHEYWEFVEQALSSVVSMLSLNLQLESLNMLMEESKLSKLIVLFELGTAKIKAGLCHLIEVISSSAETKDLGALLGNAAELLREIVRLLYREEASDAATKAVYSLCNSESNIKNLVAGGAIHGLVTYISSSQRRGRSSARVAMAAIEKLLAVKSAREELLNNPDGLNSIIKMVFKVSDHGGSESAVNSLIILCYDSVEAREEAIRGGVLSQLLLLLQSQCCVKTKTKARFLLKLLRSKWVEDKKHMV